MSKTDVTPELLAELKAKAQMATPGPWDVDGLCNIFRTPHAKDEDYHPVVLLAKSSLDEYAPTEANAAYIAAMHPGTAMALVDEIERLKAEKERLEKEANWLAEHALCHSKIGQLSCPHAFLNIKCKPFAEWRREKDALGERAGFVLIDRATCMELGKSCWREAARKTVEGKQC